MENELLDNTIQDMEYVGDIPEGWKWVKLGEVVRNVSETYIFNNDNDEVVFLNTSNIYAGKVINHQIFKVKNLPGQAKKKILKNDLLFSEIRPANKRYALIDFEPNNYVVSTKLMVLRCTNMIDNIFFKLFITSKEQLDYLQMIAEDRSGTFPQITFEQLADLDIPLPPLAEQKAIAGVLSSIDDKIELLHRQNKTLEEMAMTLFRQWFIDANFDGTICQIVNVQGGYAFKSKDFKLNGNHSVIKIKNITNSIVNINDTEFIDESVVENLDTRFKISSGDVLIAMTGAEIGKLGIVPKTNKNLWLNQRVGLLREKYDGARFIAYLHLKSEFGYDYIINAASGSAQANISASDIENCPFVQLSEDEIKAYSKTITPFFEKIIFNLGQIQTLEKLRDTLLPKLMSGEIRVKI